MDILHALFATSGAVSWAQECARAVLVFAYGLALVRIAGRRAFARWSALDIVVSIIVGSDLSRALTGSAALWGTLLATALLMAPHLGLAHAAARWHAVSRVLEGPSIALGSAGAVESGSLMRHAVSEADLQEALRNAGVEATSETRLVALEPSGTISVLKRGPERRSDVSFCSLADSP